MAIGTAAAIGLGVAGVGSAIGASANRSAAKRAARASQQATDQSVGLQREIYGQNRQALSPFMQRGNAAGNQINALLGLGGGMYQGGPAQMQMPGVQPNALSQFQPAGMAYGLGDSPGMTYGGGNSPFAQYVQANPDVMADYNNGTVDRARFATPEAYGQFHYNTYGQNEGRALPGMDAAGGQTAQQAAENAFDIFRNSTGYQFRVNEGMDALNSGFAGSGLLQSGAALRALDDYRQNAASAEFGNYMGLLGQQQAVGAGSASALAGVGQNFAANAGSLIMNNANNQANAAIARGQNNVFGNLAGTIGGGLFGYGMFGK